MKHVFLWVFLATQAATTADVAYTSRNLNRGGVEYNAAARPLTSLPRPAYIMAAEGASAGVSLLGWKMKHSKRAWVRRVWWVPQGLTIAGNTVGAAYTARHIR